MGRDETNEIKVTSHGMMHDRNRAMNLLTPTLTLQLI
jgi:hypothetical protein